MYRILIRNRESEEYINRYSYYMEEGTIYQSTNLDSVTKVFEELMETYLLNDLSIVKVVETNISISIPDLTVVSIPSNYIKLVNDGSNFSITIDLSNNKKYDSLVAIDVNSEMAASIVTYLKSIGLTNVAVNPEGITAKNLTGEPVKGALDVGKGLFLYYSRDTQTNDYISSSFSIIIRDTSGEVDPGVIPNPDDEKDPNWTWPEICPPYTDPEKKGIKVYDDLEHLGSIIIKNKEHLDRSISPFWRGKSKTESVWLYVLKEGIYMITAMAEDGTKTLSTTITVEHKDVGTGDTIDYYVDYDKGTITTNKFEE